jgi:plasmid stabilization system protein ParE
VLFLVPLSSWILPPPWWFHAEAGSYAQVWSPDADVAAVVAHVVRRGAVAVARARVRSTNAAVAVAIGGHERAQRRAAFVPADPARIVRWGAVIVARARVGSPDATGAVAEWDTCAPGFAPLYGVAPLAPRLKCRPRTHYLPPARPRPSGDANTPTTRATPAASVTTRSFKTAACPVHPWPGQPVRKSSRP